MAAELVSPYTPSFGMVPHVLAGRTELLQEHLAGLRSGPGNARFTHALTGDRGVGKTAFLTVLGQRMAGEGWAVLPYQARRERDAVHELLEQLPDALRQSWPARSLRGLQRELSVEVNAGVVKVTGKLATPATEQRDFVMPLQRALRRVGERAAKRGSGLLLTIDEAQTVPLEALADLGMIIQTVAHRDSLPVACVFAGTPELGEILLRSGSFLERMPRTELRMLTGDETRLALLEPASAHGVTWTTEALDVVAAATGGYSYFVQVGGERAWRTADGGPTIQLTAGVAGAAAIAERADQMFRDRWKRLGPAQQRYLAAAAVAAGSTPDRAVPTGEIAATLRKHQTQLSRVRASLIAEHHLLRAGDYGHVEFAFPRFAVWLQEQLAASTPTPTTLRSSRGSLNRGRQAKH
jgi:AAA ATPase domain